MEKLSAPVGRSPRTSPGDAVRNKGEDVALVRRMLRANKYMVAEEGGVDAGLIKAINAVQIKAGMKTPDGVVDPDSKVWKSLLPKYLIEKKAAENIKLYEIKYKGKTYQLTEADYKAMKADILRRLKSYVDAVASNHKFNMKIYEEYLEIAMLKQGYLTAITQAITMSVGRIKFPDDRIVGNSITAVGKMERAMMTGNLALLDTAIPEAEAAVNAFVAEVRRFLNQIIGSAENVTTVLQVTSGVSFAVVGVMAAPVLVTAAGMTAASAAVASSAGVAVLSSASTELGKAASGQKMTLWGSVWNVAVDGTVGAATAGLANKVPLGLVTKFAKGAAPVLASKLPGVTAAQITPYLVKFMVGSGEEVVKSALGEAITLVGKSFKSGKMPTEKDFEEAGQKILLTALTAGLLKNLGTFQKKWAFEAHASFKAKMLPDVIRSFKLKSDLPPVVTAKVVADVWNKVSEEFSKAGLAAVMGDDNPKDDPSRMLDAASKQVQRDSRLRAIVEAETRKALKKQKIEVK